MRPLLCLLLILIQPATVLQADTLRGAFDAAGPGQGFDKLVILESGRLYTGGLLIGPLLIPETGVFDSGKGLDLRIIGNGAVLDLRGGQICISYCDNRLEIEDCVVLNGNIRFRGIDWEPGHIPQGTVSQVTFYAPHDYGVRIQGCGDGIAVERNLFVDARDTGPDWVYHNSFPFDWIYTGLNVAMSTHGMPTMTENWSFHGDPEINSSPLRHFGFL
jgi:hypothetical protein